MQSNPGFEIHNVLRTASLENLLVFLKEHPINLNNPYCLAGALFNNDDPKVFNFIYNQMSVSSSHNFKEKIFDALFFDNNALINSILLPNKKGKILKSFLNTDDFPFVINLNQDNIKKFSITCFMINTLISFKNQ